RGAAARAAARAGPRLRRPAGRRGLAAGRRPGLRHRRLRPADRRARGHPRAGPGGRRRAVGRRVAPLARGRLPRAHRHRRGGEPEMSISRRHVRAIFRKELREYRHNGSIVWTMAVIPLIFILPAPSHIFGVAAGSGPSDLLLYMLGIPALVPSVVAAYSVVGERQQGTLEPVLTTPVRREEFLLGKALAALVPSLAISYGVYVVVVACVELFADPGVASEVVRWPELLAQLVFSPLLAGWS